jgi:sugar phosphate permease
MAFLLYLDRNCMGEIIKSDLFKSDFPNEEKTKWFLSAFYFSYAISQIPAGWASDRWGARKMLTLYILAWSLMTLMTGLVASLWGLFIARFVFGIAQAGAYPASGGVVRRWFPLHQRGQASSWISLGGRFGGVLAPLITALLIDYFAGWRSALVLYGCMGFAIALLYWIAIRDRPTEHPGVNEEEIREIGHAPDQHSRQIHTAQVLSACLTNRSLWLCSVTQFCTNAGWVFLVAWLPTYLDKVKLVSSVWGAVMVTVVLTCGLPGMLMGGWVSDQAVKRLGLRWGRVLPVTSAMTIAAIAYWMCPFVDSVWLLVVCCGMVAMMVDFSNPSFWASMQDLGGPNTSTIFGWANMWGNLGASFSTFVTPMLLALGGSLGMGNLLAFIALSLFFLIAAIAMLGVNTSYPIQVAPLDGR